MQFVNVLVWLQASPVRALLANFSHPVFSGEHGGNGCRGPAGRAAGSLPARPRRTEPGMQCSGSRGHGTTAPCSSAAASKPRGSIGGTRSKPRADELRGTAPPASWATRNEAKPCEQLVLVQLLQLGALLQPGKYQAIRTLISHMTLSTCREAELHAEQALAGSQRGNP